MLRIENLRKEFKDVVAVDSLTFSVSPGKIFGLLGPNGAGKTTTIRTILNIIKPTSGKVSFRGDPIRGESMHILGYLPEERGLYKKSRVGDVLAYLARLKGLSTNKISGEIAFWLDRLGIPDFQSKKIEELSKGNQQKIQFISSVIHKPEILILDEPFAGFDPINQQIIRDIIFQFSSEEKIIILSTHQMDTAERLCNDILLLNNGKEILHGDLSSIRKRFGSNYVRVEFSGNSSFLENNPDIVHLSCYNGYAEVQLREAVKPSEFLRTISGTADILHFSVIEPGLNKIFIDTIKDHAN